MPADLPAGRARRRLDVTSNEELHRILNDWTDIIPAHFDTYPLVDLAATNRMLAEQAGRS